MKEEQLKTILEQARQLAGGGGMLRGSWPETELSGEHRWATFPFEDGDRTMLMRVDDGGGVDVVVDARLGSIFVGKLYPDSTRFAWRVNLTQGAVEELGGVLSEVGELMQKLATDQKRATALWPARMR